MAIILTLVLSVACGENTLKEKQPRRPPSPTRKARNKMDNSYNPDKLAEAIKAFGKERLEELREEFPRGRLAEHQDGKDVFVVHVDNPNDPTYLNEKDSELYSSFEHSLKYYLEPPRPLRKEGNGHTKEEMRQAYQGGRGDGHMDRDRFNDWYSKHIATATAPTTEPQEPSQPQPSFTREETERLIRDLRYLTADPKMGSREVHKLRGVILNKLGWELCQPLPSRLDLLIKWWGEQERPSEITFKGEAMASQPTPYPTQWDKYYRRGTSEWISLEGVV